MPRYFFDIHDGSDIPDDEGLEFPDFESARRAAIEAAGEILRDSSRNLGAEDWVMEVTDEVRKPVLTLRFSLTEH